VSIVGGMDTKKYIATVVDECFAIRKRAPIPRYAKIISLGGNMQISRKSVKYIMGK